MYVYAISNQSGYVKIGYGTNVASRLSQIQVGSPVDLELVAVERVPNAALAKQRESELHNVFADRAARGEWFRVDLAGLAEHMPLLPDAGQSRAEMVEEWYSRSIDSLSDFAAQNMMNFHKVTSRDELKALLVRKCMDGTLVQ